MDILKKRHPPSHYDTDRIAFDVAADARIVVAEDVIVCECLPVEILPREPQVEDERGSRAPWVVVGQVAAKRFGVVPSPHRLTLLVGNQPGCV